MQFFRKLKRANKVSYETYRYSLDKAFVEGRTLLQSEIYISYLFPKLGKLRRHYKVKYFVFKLSQVLSFAKYSLLWFFYIHQNISQSFNICLATDTNTSFLIDLIVKVYHISNYSSGLLSNNHIGII